MMMGSSMTMEKAMGAAPGWRFCPGEHEIIESYLLPKLLNQPIAFDEIPQADVFALHPQQLAESFLPSGMFGDEWWFFSSTKRRDAGGSVAARSSSAGQWKANITTKDVRNPQGRVVGTKQGFKFLQTTKTHEKKKETVWLMEEFVVKSMRTRNTNNKKLDDWVMCKLYLTPKARRRGLPHGRSSLNSCTARSGNGAMQQLTMMTEANLPDASTSGGGEEQEEGNMMGDETNFNEEYYYNPPEAAVQQQQQQSFDQVLVAGDQTEEWVSWLADVPEDTATTGNAGALVCDAGATRGGEAMIHYQPMQQSTTMTEAIDHPAVQSSLVAQSSPSPVAAELIDNQLMQANTLDASTSGGEEEGTMMGDHEVNINDGYYYPPEAAMQQQRSSDEPSPEKEESGEELISWLMANLIEDTTSEGSADALVSAVGTMQPTKTTLGGEAISTSCYYPEPEAAVQQQSVDQVAEHQSSPAMASMMNIQDDDEMDVDCSTCTEDGPEARAEDDQVVAAEEQSMRMLPTDGDHKCKEANQGHEQVFWLKLDEWAKEEFSKQLKQMDHHASA